MTDKPLVSIVTPCFNSSQFIESCIKSVLAQDYPYVEHIIHDGASTDGTVDILKKYFGKVDWVSEPDKGQSDGLNKALQRCKGDIILVLNADDELLPHAASWGVDQMAKHPEVAVVYGDQYTINEEGEITNDYRYNHTYAFDKLLCVELVPPAQAAFIRRSLFAPVGLYADDELDTCPDYEMWVRIGLKFPMLYVPEFITKYRTYRRELDSKNKRTIERFVKSKRMVMDRVFNDVNTDASIRKLRKKAYASLDIWAASMEADEGNRSNLWSYLYSALRIDFSVNRIRQVLNIILIYTVFGSVFRFFMKYYLKTIIKIKKILGLPIKIENETRRLLDMPLEIVKKDK
jgi:glycosyltransferase involved in cell wall biosynthesis